MTATADDADTPAGGRPRDRADVPRPQAGTTVVRFSRASRIAHWTLGGPFVVLLVTGLLLYVPRAKGLHVGGYRLFPLIHVLSGVALMLGLLMAFLVQPRRAPLFADLRRLLRVAPGDGAWLRYAAYALLGAHVKQPPTGKFNAGQKLNTLVSAIFTGGLLLTGVVLGVNYVTKSLFSATFVEQIYPYHGYFSIISIPFVTGHIYLAVIHPGTRPSLRGMLTGTVERSWALRHHERWVAELERSANTPER